MPRPLFALSALSALIALGGLTACGLDATEADVKLAGVGLNPDEIGPKPTLAGGLVEYDWFNFAGGGLSLAALGFTSYDEVGPTITTFAPPYAVVYGLAFLFDDLVPAPDVHHGAVAVPPAVEDTCWTNTEPFSYLMASTAEAGDKFVFSDTTGSTRFKLARNPEIYPPDPQDVFVYYISVESWHPAALSAPLPGGGERVLNPANFTHGATVDFSFAGGIPPVEAPVSSIPRPSASAPHEALTLPNRASALRMSWNGPLYGPNGATGEEGPLTTCVQYHYTPLEQAAFEALTAEEQAALCKTTAPLPETPAELIGQIYTGPWDTNDGSVTLHWEPGAAGETVSFSVRFLGPLDRESEAFLRAQVPMEAPPGVQSDWDRLLDRGDVEGGLPQGTRAPLPCDDPDEIQWVFDPSLVDANGDTNVELQGDPSVNLAEVTCRLTDDGEFTLTQEHLAGALDYAARKGSEGALFYFSRSTGVDVNVPPVRDQAGRRVETSPVLVRSNSVEIGRFWVSGGFSAAQETN
jgi:hypothetical protein